MESDREKPPGTWSAPQCPFKVEYSPRVLDDIRLAVVDAFFSLPRGGAEIGGILLGSFGDGLVRIADYRAIDCEHAHGPSFTLSDRDRVRLAESIGAAKENPAGLRPVGWYHSHTRSGIFLSEADLELHNRYFPEPWQTALVLRPHTLEPTRGGFFFREPDGPIRGEASYLEFVLEPLTVRPVPAVTAPPVAAPAPPPPRGGRPAGPVIELTAAVVDEPAPPAPAAPPARTPAPPPQEPPAAAVAPAGVQAESVPVPVPRFLEAQPPASRRGLWALVIVALALAAAAGGYETRQQWLPRLSTLVRRSPPPPPPAYAGLTAVDLAGQLQIRWDRNSPAVRSAAGAVLEISDGAAPRRIDLDADHLQAGAFTYARQSGKVDVALRLRLPGGREFQEATSYLGRAPGAPDAETDKGRAEAAKETAKIKSDLKTQRDRTTKLEKSLEEVKKQLREQQLRRLQNQEPGK